MLRIPIAFSINWIFLLKHDFLFTYIRTCAFLMYILQKKKYTYLLPYSCCCLKNKIIFMNIIDTKDEWESESERESVRVSQKMRKWESKSEWVKKNCFFCPNIFKNSYDYNFIYTKTNYNNLCIEKKNVWSDIWNSMTSFGGWRTDCFAPNGFI